MNAAFVTSESKDVAPTPTPVATVVTGGKVSLAEHLALKDLPLATTPGGRNFAMKALHPSDHEIKSTRVPGGNTMSASLCCDMVQTIPIPDANTQVDITLIPNIAVPASVKLHEGIDRPASYWTITNAAFGGSFVNNATSADFTNVLNAIQRNIQTYRITSQSATVELIAPALSDQGTITAAQYHLPPRVTGFVERTLMAGSSGTSYSAGSAQIFPKVELYENPVLASQLVLGTSAYTSKAKEGVYMPLKLTKFKYQNMNDPRMMFETAYELAERGTQAVNASGITYFPFYHDHGSANLATMPAFPPNCGYNFGFITFNGMAGAVALRLRIRQVVEITCYPSSTYAPIMEVALPPDDTALRMYYEISQRMADGYPASYNDLGKLKSIIAGIAKKVAPFVSPALDILSKMPGVAGTVGAIGKQLLPAARNFQNAADRAYRSVMAEVQRKVGTGGKGPDLVKQAIAKADRKFQQKTSAKKSSPPSSTGKQTKPVITTILMPRRPAPPPPKGSGGKPGGSGAPKGGQSPKTRSKSRKAANRPKKK